MARWTRVISSPEPRVGPCRSEAVVAPITAQSIPSWSEASIKVRVRSSPARERIASERRVRVSHSAYSRPLLRLMTTLLSIDRLLPPYRYTQDVVTQSVRSWLEENDDPNATP